MMKSPVLIDSKKTFKTNAFEKKLVVELVCGDREFWNLPKSLFAFFPPKAIKS